MVDESGTDREQEAALARLLRDDSPAPAVEQSGFVSMQNVKGSPTVRQQHTNHHTSQNIHYAAGRADRSQGSLLTGDS
jgi:hypothetical protein